VRRAALALALLLPAARAAAEAAIGPADRDLRPAFLQLWVNEVPGVTALSLVGTDGDVWVPPEELSRSGLFGFEGARRDVEGRTFVSLRSLGPDLRFTIDERALAIRIVAGRDLLRHSILDLAPSARPPGVETPRVASAFLNWSGHAATDELHSAFGEAGVASGNALLSSSVSASPATGVVRGLSALTIDAPGPLVRLVAGDALVRRDALGGAPLFGGLSIGREWSLDPYLVRAPLPQASAFAATPSTVEVYLNGALVGSEQVSPGTYDLTHLPVAAGTSDLQIVVRDAFGRTETLQVEHYAAQGLLAPGLHDWSWQLGAVRERYGLASFDYGTPLVAGRHRLGLALGLTAGASAEATPELAQGSASVAVATPLGELEASGAASVDRGRPGGAGLVAWRSIVHRMSFGADGSLLSGDYANVSLRADDPRPRWRASAHVQFPIGRDASGTLRWVGSRDVAGEWDRFEARTTLPLSRVSWLVLSGAVDRSPVRGTDTTALVQLVVATPDGSTVDAGGRRAGGVASATAGAQRPLTTGPSVGYRVRGDTVGAGTVSALLQAQPSFGRFEVTYDRAEGSEVAGATASGGLVLVSDRLFVTRPVEQAFALVRVPGVGGVRAYLEHVPVGRTDASGDLLVPGLLANYASRLAIADADVPPSYRIGAREHLVALPARAGGVVRFDVARLRAVTGTVRLSGHTGTQVPAYGTLEVDGPRGPLRSPIADDGTFWLDDVPEGAHAARVYWRGDVCEFSLSVKSGAEPIVNAGNLGCEERARP
jgi:outer membrane usher protein